RRRRAVDGARRAETRRPGRAPVDPVLHRGRARDARAVRVHQRSAGRRRPLRGAGAIGGAFGGDAAGRWRRVVVSRERQHQGEGGQRAAGEVPGQDAPRAGAVRSGAGGDRSAARPRRSGAAPAGRQFLQVGGGRPVGAEDDRRRARRDLRRRRSGARQARRSDGAGSGAGGQGRGRPAARRLARAAAPDLVVLGKQVGAGQPRAEQVGSTFLVAAAEEMARVGRIDFVLRGAGPLVDAGGPDAAAMRRVEIDAALARLDEELKRWSSSSAGGDPAFVAAKQRERAALEEEKKGLDRPWTAPAAGNYFTNRLIPLRRSLPRDPKVAAEMRKLDAQVAAINLGNAPPPAPREPGRAYYVGDAKCGACHKRELAFWKTTVHATAWKTLVEGGKENDYKCVGCHGPGSVHVAEKGLEDPPAVHKETPASTCTTCHTEQHSDTFQYQAYLRDIVGPGHGAAARAKLGDGPTGHALRSAALARAKVAGAAEAQKLN